eukprot:scaffold381_cov168-Ochromonas_danica.AAC.46
MEAVYLFCTNCGQPLMKKETVNNERRKRKEEKNQSNSPLKLPLLDVYMNDSSITGKGRSVSKQSERYLVTSSSFTGTFTSPIGTARTISTARTVSTAVSTAPSTATTRTRRAGTTNITRSSSSSRRTCTTQSDPSLEETIAKIKNRPSISKQGLQADIERSFMLEQQNSIGFDILEEQLVETQQKPSQTALASPVLHHFESFPTIDSLYRQQHSHDIVLKSYTDQQRELLQPIRACRLLEKDLSTMPIVLPRLSTPGVTPAASISTSLSFKGEIPVESKPSTGCRAWIFQPSSSHLDQDEQTEGEGESDVMVGEAGMMGSMVEDDTRAKGSGNDLSHYVESMSTSNDSDGEYEHLATGEVEEEAIVEKNFQSKLSDHQMLRHSPTMLPILEKVVVEGQEDDDDEEEEEGGELLGFSPFVVSLPAESLLGDKQEQEKIVLEKNISYPSHVTSNGNEEEEAEEEIQKKESDSPNNEQERGLKPIERKATEEGKVTKEEQEDEEAWLRKLINQDELRHSSSHSSKPLALNQLWYSMSRGDSSALGRKDTTRKKKKMRRLLSSSKLKLTSNFDPIMEQQEDEEEDGDNDYDKKDKAIYKEEEDVEEKSGSKWDANSVEHGNSKSLMSNIQNTKNDDSSGSISKNDRNSSITVSNLFIHSYQQMKRCLSCLDDIDLRVNVQDLKYPVLERLHEDVLSAKEILQEAYNVDEIVQSTVDLFYERARSHRAALATSISEALQKASSMRDFFHQQLLHMKHGEGSLQSMSGMSSLSKMNHQDSDEMKEIEIKAADYMATSELEIDRLQQQENRLLDSLREEEFAMIEAIKAWKEKHSKQRVALSIALQRARKYLRLDP